jgi:hypothetical protein
LLTDPKRDVVDMESRDEVTVVGLKGGRAGAALSNHVILSWTWRPP